MSNGLIAQADLSSNCEAAEGWRCVEERIFGANRAVQATDITSVANVAERISSALVAVMQGVLMAHVECAEITFEAHERLTVRCTSSSSQNCVIGCDAHFNDKVGFQATAQVFGAFETNTTT